MDVDNPLVQKLYATRFLLGWVTVTLICLTVFMVQERNRLLEQQAMTQARLLALEQENSKATARITDMEAEYTDLRRRLARSETRECWHSGPYPIYLRRLQLENADLRVVLESIYRAGKGRKLFSADLLVLPKVVTPLTPFQPVPQGTGERRSLR